MAFSYLIKRLCFALPVLWAVSTIVFLLIHIIPGDPVDLILGERAMVADRVQLAQGLHLDEPLLKQYGRFMGGLARGDLGESIFDHRPVTEYLSERAGATALLALCAMSLAILIAIPAGVFSAIKRDRLFDRCAMLLALVGISIPNFWLGPVLILVFSVDLGWLPISGRSGGISLILPTITLGLALAAMLSRLTRSSMIDEVRREYVLTARAKGLTETRVMFKHALRNALTPVITIIGMQVGSLLAGAVITEKIFSWPGVGSLLLDAISRRDYPLVQGCILLISFTYVIVNVATDCLYKAVDPRVKL